MRRIKYSNHYNRYHSFFLFGVILFLSTLTHLQVYAHHQTLIAVNDFNETPYENTVVEGNVLTNDLIQGSNSRDFSVTNAGTWTTDNGGTLVLNSDGSYTYTPKKNFSGLDSYEYQVQINGSSVSTNATLFIGVAVCTTSVQGKDFSWRYPAGYKKDGHTISTEFEEPGTDYGFVLNIYTLDNSFNMEINGVELSEEELQFQDQSGYTLRPNIRFKSDGGYWGKNGVPNIWTLSGNATHPIIQVDISPEGTVKIYGSRTSGGELEELELFNGNYFHNIVWNKSSSNTVLVTQKVIGATAMSGSGSGLNITRCINYWMGGEPGKEHDWATASNWTLGRIPESEEDVEFATVDNYGTAAVADLYLDNLNQDNSGGRIIGNLINNSDKNLVITTGNQLRINGTVTDGNPDKGTIIIKADPYNSEANGTLIFADPTQNQNVGATVEFYNKAYYCTGCGLYKKQWQYFGIPVQSATFPMGDVTGNETVNQWVEPFTGTNKWQTAPYTPDTQLIAFRGYEITNDATQLPTAAYNFPGTLYTGNATVPLTKTANVSYSGANLIGNSYTAAIPIATALSFSTAITDQSVYLFNTGTRDQWRKLDGSSVQFSGVAGGQYLAVPFYLAGQIPSGSSTALPSMIPATQSFMILADKATNLAIDYSKLVKNQTITDAGGNTIATRAATETQSSPEGSTSAAQLPSVVMDVIGDNSADRVWIFSKSGTSYGFDSGWDGRKLGDENSSQLYVTASDSSKLQVATVPSLDKVAVGFLPTEDGTYTLEFAVSGTSNALYLNDLIAGKRQQIVNGGSYTFTASKSEVKNRFTLSYAGESTAFSTDEALISVTPTSDGIIRIANGSDRSCSASLSDEKGRFIQRREVKAGGEESLEGLAKGTYIVRLQNAVVNDTRKIKVGNN